ncbi:hypothetical protein P170DRAFT_446889 [Aspergillus steynii IBT 23096]|uniref:Uncharacterized protein n=1 Tax=Aspergillus steynii IBT 23096 TaxID=1392250 RepID=A0A2I2G8F2_9EURO|nr:uncharacterized protein P170DRAFT_446889 [Aspergillus steynii IBT 23096]PLB49157.1 hypothetical protein P170DRAFT_446889 [Aspergillus steynii IBT 23096]
MSFFFGRRHSISGAPPLHDDAMPTTLRRRSSQPHVRPPATEPRAQGGMFHELFRRHQDLDHDHDQGREQGHGHERGQDGETMKGVTNTATATVAAGQVESSPNDKTTASTEQPPSEEVRRKPTARTKSHTKLSTPSAETELAREDTEFLFSGAPVFLLDKGRHCHWYLQVIFPFDDHDPFIQNLWDRRPLAHASFTLCTLHAHLPLPDGWVIQGDNTPVRLECWKRAAAPKRASFDVGIFETPNMLSMYGREPGTIGSCHFLELPICDAVRYVGPEVPRPMAGYMHLSSLPASAAYELMEHYQDPYSRCEDGTVHDRKELLCEGPLAWRRIGVRDIGLRTLVERLRELADVRDEILHGTKATSIMDRESVHELSRELFTNFLYPLPHFMMQGINNPHGIKAQIKALTVVLATPGAWANFSLAEWRLRAGQLLWEAAPHVDGDFLDPSGCDKPWVHPTLERKWYLVQMLLAGELLLRLDATVRVGILGHSNELRPSMRDMLDFDRTRNGKVDWDIVVVRRLMDSFDISYVPDEPAVAPDEPSSPSSPTHQKSERHHHRFFENFIHRSEPPPVGPVESSWNCKLIPSRVHLQMQGLFVFADNIGWPGLETVKARLQSKIGDDPTNQAIVDVYNTPTHNVVPDGLELGSNIDEMYSRSPSRRRLLLHCAQDTGEIGGWITRSWLSGFVMPGEMINHLLMATMLENDPEAMAQLGPVVNLYGGVSYSGRSWWSKECIVGRVLASLDGTKESMGWISSPVVPKASQTSEDIHNSWFEVVVKPVPQLTGKPRIKQGQKLTHESSPLPVRNTQCGAFSLPTDGPVDGVKVTFEGLSFSGRDGQQPLQGSPHLVAHKSCMTVTLASETIKLPRTLSLPLTYNVQFIASHECRPPGGFISSPNTPSASSAGTGTDTNSSSASSSGSSHKHHRLPGHPLYRTYAYKVLSLDALPEPSAPETISLDRMGMGRTLSHHQHQHQQHEVIVLDARGSRDKETLARAWCASAGHNAIIGRVGRTCLACCIREAYALSVKTVIRVGEGHPSRTPSVQTIPV